MVYRLYMGVTGNKIQKLKQKTVNLTMAFVLAFTAIVPALTAQTATAAPSTAYTNRDFTSLGLVTDRQAPSGGQSITPAELTIGVDNTAANTSGTGFYQTEGLQGSFPTSQTISAELYVDPAWSGKQVRAGLWGTTHSATGPYTGWPILEYTTVGDGSFTGWRMYDTMVTGDWTNLPAIDATPGSWYTLEIAYNGDTDMYDYYINNVLAGSLTAMDGGDTYNQFDGVIFNNKNFATTNSADDYMTTWRTFKTGLTLLPAPANVRLVRGAAPVADGSIINYTDVTLKWDTISDPARYRATVVHPDGTSTNFQPSTNAGWNPASIGWSISDSVRRGYFGAEAGDKGEGIYKYSVAVKDPVTGLWSEESPQLSLTYDKTRPTIEVVDPSTDYAVLSNSDSLKVKATDNIALKRVTLNIYTDTGVLTDPNSELTSDTEHTMTVPLTGLPEGDYYFRTNSQDAAMNPLASTITRHFTIDNTKPTVTITSPANSAVLGSNDFTVLGTASDAGSTIDSVKYTVTKITGIGGTYVSNISDGTATGTDNWSFPVSALAEGYYRLKVQAFDAAGNWKYMYHDIHVDTTAPTITVKAGYVGDETAKIFSEVSFKLYDANKVDKYVLNGWTNDLTDSMWSDANFQNIKSHLIEGINSFVLYDVAGNSTTYEFTYDSIAPVVEITNPSNDDAISGVVTISGTVTDVNPSHYYLVVKDTSGSVVDGPGTVHTAAVADFEWDTTGLPDDDYIIFLSTRDAAGNKDGNATTPGVSVDSIVVTVDNTKPTLSITNPVDESVVPGEFSVEGTASDDGAGVSVVKYNIAHLTEFGGSTFGAKVVPFTDVLYDNTTDTWSFDIDLPDGYYRISVRTEDGAGNFRARHIDVLVDATAPTVIDANNFVLSMFTGDKITLAPEATDEHEPLTYSWSVSDKLLLNDPKDSLDSETLDIGPTKKGTYTATVTVRDTLGNESMETYDITVLTPAVAPQSNENPQTLGSTTNTSSSNSNSNTTRGNRANTPAVTPEESSTTTESEEGEVQGISTTTANLASASGSADTTRNTGAFLGLGWWWLPLLVLLFGFFFLALGRRSD